MYFYKSFYNVHNTPECLNVLYIGIIAIRAGQYFDEEIIL